MILIAIILTRFFMIVKKDYIFEQYQKYRFKWMPNCAPCLFYNLAFIEAFLWFLLIYNANH